VKKSTNNEVVVRIVPKALLKIQTENYTQVEKENIFGVPLLKNGFIWIKGRDVLLGGLMSDVC